jgi:lysyl-tRNA synthetase class 2
VFLDVRDGSGSIQVVMRRDTTRRFDFWRSVLDRGDFIATSGRLFKTRRGEESIEGRMVGIAAKSTRPLPTEWYNITDVETRLRDRYLDILLHPETRELFVKKEKFWDAFRRALKGKGFLEVETPVFERVPGGADAEPFRTHHNALNADFYLRISLELPLKRLLVGGMDKVFEVGRVFRNEGIDREHLQEFTELEFYWAYADYRDLMRFAEPLYKSVIKQTTGGLVTTWNGKKVNWGRKWPSVDYVGAFKKENGINLLAASVDELKKRARKLGAETSRGIGKGRLIDAIYKRTVRPKLIQPCFLVNHPVDVSPLAKRSEKDPRVAERAQVLACGTELGNGWSELNDPADQRARFEEQMKLRKAGDKEAQMLDENYLEAMEYGMPPAAGWGVAERLFAVLMDKPVRETVIFPPMRPREKR